MTGDNNNQWTASTHEAHLVIGTLLNFYNLSKELQLIIDFGIRTFCLKATVTDIT